MRYIYILITSLILVGCVQNQPKPKPEQVVIKLQTLSQKVGDNAFNQKKEVEKFFRIYFKPWNEKKFPYTKKEAMWGFAYAKKGVYLENYLPAPKGWFKRIKQNANFESFGTLLKPAITLKNASARVLPTNSPLFYKPTKPGEGFPFDYNQNTLLYINTPILVSHLSRDRAWAYVHSSNADGWVDSSAIAFVDDKFIKEFQTEDYFVAVKEKFPLYTPKFREYVKIGSIFPKDKKGFIVSLNNGSIKHININTTYIQKMPILFNDKNRLKISHELLGEPYGWGGLLENRDCSAFTRDFFAPFGKFLPRNSKAQSKVGEYFDISKLTNREKKEYIIKHAKPFSTLIYMRGHVMIYVGFYKNTPLIMHNMWSVKLWDKNKNQFRHFMGKTRISTLEVGRNMEGYDEKKSSLLSKIRGIIVF